MKVTVLKQTSHDMIAHVGKARAAVEELRKFLIDDSLEEVNRKLDKFYMILILRSLHSDFDHVRDQVPAGDQVPSMDSLITRLLCVPHLLKDENPADGVETSAMVASRGREEAAATVEEVAVEGVDVLIAPIARGWVTPKRIAIRCKGFPTRSHRSLDQRKQNLDSLMRSIRSI